MAIGAIVRLVSQRAQLVEHPVHTAQLAQAAHHLGIGDDQVLDVIDRILNLLIGQRAARQSVSDSVLGSDTPQNV